MKKYFKCVFLFCIGFVILTGCMSELVVPGNNLNSVITEISTTGENTEGVSGAAKGTLKIYLTNSQVSSKKPPIGILENLQGPPAFVNHDGEYLEVNIDISRIEGHIAGDEEEGEDEGYWKILQSWTPGKVVDLKKAEDVSILLASLDLEPNKYTQLRIFLNEAWLVLAGEEERIPLTIPSSAQTGIKLNHPFEIVAGSITKLTIDFDADKSVIKTGNGKYLMKPVIGLSSETYSSGEEVPEGTGTVFGSVSYYNSSEDPALAGIGGAEIELTGGTYLFTNTTTTSTIDPIGTFSLTDVPAGSYVLNVYADGYDDYSESIEIIFGSDTIVHVVFLIEEPGRISGSVKDSVSKDPIEGAIITVTLSGGSTYDFARSTESDGDGYFLIEQLTAGSYDLVVEADGYDVGSASGIVVDPEETTGPVNMSLDLSTT